MHKPLSNSRTKFARRFSWTSVIAIALSGVGLLSQSRIHAQIAQTPPIFENVTIRPKFSPDPLTIRGISGGAVSAPKVAGRQETATGPCAGFVDDKPDHTIVLTSFFNYLSLQVQSPEDTTIVISGPGGTWCNDDSQAKNPGLAGQWLAGTYQVWIGSYDKTKFVPYIIKITEVDLLNPGPFRR